MEISKEMKLDGLALDAEDMAFKKAVLAAIRVYVAALHAEPCDPVGYVTAVELTKLSLGASCVDLFGKVVPKGFEMVPVYSSPTPSLGVDIEEVKRQARDDALEEAAKLATTCINPADRCKCSTAYEISAAIRALSKIEGGEDGK
jgi:hypothetical protein